MPPSAMWASNFRSKVEPFAGAGHVSTVAAARDNRGHALAQSAATMRPYRVVQPWGPDKAREATLISEHPTAADAFAEIDRVSAQMVRTGAPSDAVELLVVNAAGKLVPRPDTH